MKGETQSLHLQEMMQQLQRNPEYMLAFPPLMIKKKSLKKISIGEILLLDLNMLDLYLFEGERPCARVSPEQYGEFVKLKIVSLVKSPDMTVDSKKYEKILCTFGTVQSRKMEVGHKIEISADSLSEVILSAEGKKLAKGSLVIVDKKLAIEITEVENG